MGEILQLPRGLGKQIMAQTANGDAAIAPGARTRPANYGGARFHRGECVAGENGDIAILLFDKRVYTWLANRPCPRTALLAARDVAGEGVDESCVQSKETKRKSGAGAVLHRQSAGKQEQSGMLKNYFRG